MAKCEYCGSSILFGGVKNGEYRFCNKEHAQRGNLILAGRQIPDHIVVEQTRQVHGGDCPRCKGPGPVDVHNSYQVYSLVLMTSWRTNTIVGCRRCGRMQNLKDGLISLLAGWWGIPWGLLVTPIQLFRNVTAAFGPSDALGPSAALTQLIRVDLAARIYQRGAAAPMAPRLS